MNTIDQQLATPLHALMWNLDNVESKLLRKNVKLLLRAGANVNVFWNMTSMYDNKYNHNALRYYIIQCPTFSVQPDKKVCMLLYAAGETTDGTTVKRTSNAGYNEKVRVPQFLLQKRLKMDLKHMCRNAIRNHLISMDPHTHLFNRIPQLGLPRSLTDYVLYNMSLDGDDGDDNGCNDDDDDDNDNDDCNDDDIDDDDDDDDDDYYYGNDDDDDGYDDGDDHHSIDDDKGNGDDDDNDDVGDDDDRSNDDVTEVVKELQVTC